MKKKPLTRVEVRRLLTLHEKLAWQELRRGLLRSTASGSPEAIRRKFEQELAQ